MSSVTERLLLDAAKNTRENGVFKESSGSVSGHSIYISSDESKRYAVDDCLQELIDLKPNDKNILVEAIGFTHGYTSPYYTLQLLEFYIVNYGVDDYSRNAILATKLDAKGQGGNSRQAEWETDMISKLLGRAEGERVHLKGLTLREEPYGLYVIKAVIEAAIALLNANPGDKQAVSALREFLGPALDEILETEQNLYTHYSGSDLRHAVGWPTDVFEEHCPDLFQKYKKAGGLVS